MRTLKNLLLSLAVMLGLGVSATYAGGVKYEALVVYGDNIQLPMHQIIANLYNSTGDLIGSSMTNANGIFKFNNLIEGQNYRVEFETKLKGIGVDLGDASVLLNYLSGIGGDLNEIQLIAADVDDNFTVDFQDYNLIIQHILRGKKFPAGEWKFPVWYFTAPAEDDNNFKATRGPDGPITIVSSGDISNELPIVIKTTPIINDNIIEFGYKENQQELTLPISFVKNQKVFGIGLDMAFDNLDIEITGIESNLNNYDYVIERNAFKFSWVSSEIEEFAANGEILKLRVRINSLDDMNALLSKISESQFVGTDGKLIQNVQLNMPLLKKSIIDFSIGTPYPNPGNYEINFGINQIYATNVNVEIYNLAGQLVKQVSVPTRSNKITISTSDLPNGSYLCSLAIDAERAVKLINVQH